MALITVIGTTVAIVLAPFTLAAAFAARRNPENLATPFSNVCQHQSKRVLEENIERKPSSTQCHLKMSR